MRQSSTLPSVIRSWNIPSSPVLLADDHPPHATRHESQPGRDHRLAIKVGGTADTARGRESDGIDHVAGTVVVTGHSQRDSQLVLAEQGVRMDRTQHRVLPEVRDPVSVPRGFVVSELCRCLTDQELCPQVQWMMVSELLADDDDGPLKR